MRSKPADEEGKQQAADKVKELLNSKGPTPDQVIARWGFHSDIGCS
jgi:hypothetical protein